jgi:hypothetical protein
MEQERENVRVIDDPPKPQSSGVFLFRWSIVLGFLVAWMVVLIAAIWIKAGVFRVLLPAILVVLLIYLLVCTLTAIRSKS